MKWLIALLIVGVIWWQYRHGLISTGEADNGVFAGLALALFKL